MRKAASVILPVVNGYSERNRMMLDHFVLMCGTYVPLLLYVIGPVSLAKYTLFSMEICAGFAVDVPGDNSTRSQPTTYKIHFIALGQTMLITSRETSHWWCRTADSGDVELLHEHQPEAHEV